MSLDSILRSNPNKVTIPSNSKNLITFPYTDTTKIYNGITWTVNSDGSVTANGTTETAEGSYFNVSSNIQLEQGKQYTLSGFTSDAANIMLIIADSTDKQIQVISQQYGTTTFTTSYTNYKIILVILSMGTTVSNATFYPQLEEGVEATDFSLNTGDKDVWKIRYGSKNIFRPDYFSTSHTVSGMTCQYLPNEDCYLFNGTSTASNQIRDLNYWFPDVLNKSITITSHYIDGEATVPDGKYFVAYAGNSDSLLEDMSNFIDCMITKSANKTKICTKQGLHGLWFYFSSGVTATNLKVKMQLEIGSAATTYVPYSRETVWTSSENNLLSVSTADTQTITGITFTNNSDGTITVAGTATANSTFNLGTFNISKNRPLTLKGCPSGGSASSYYLYAYDTTNNRTYPEYGSGVTFTPSVDSLNLYIRVQNGTTVNSLLFKPWLEYAAGNN